MRNFDKDADNIIAWGIAWIIVLLMVYLALAIAMRAVDFAMQPLPTPTPPTWGISL